MNETADRKHKKLKKKQKKTKNPKKQDYLISLLFYSCYFTFSFRTLGLWNKVSLSTGCSTIQNQIVIVIKEITRHKIETNKQ